MASNVAGTEKRPRVLYLISAILLFQGISALFGGFLLVADPSGGLLQMPSDVLSGTPFRDFLIPGLILLLVLGVFPLIAVAGLWVRPNLGWLSGLEQLIHEHWSWLASLLVGVFLITWITVQGLLLGFGHPLQWTYLIVGAAITVTTLSPQLRRYLAA